MTSVQHQISKKKQSHIQTMTTILLTFCCQTSKVHQQTSWYCWSKTKLFSPIKTMIWQTYIPTWVNPESRLPLLKKGELVDWCRLTKFSFSIKSYLQRLSENYKTRKQVMGQHKYLSSMLHCCLHLANKTDSKRIWSEYGTEVDCRQNLTAWSLEAICSLCVKFHQSLIINCWDTLQTDTLRHVS